MPLNRSTELVTKLLFLIKQDDKQQAYDTAKEILLREPENSLVQEIRTALEEHLNLGNSKEKWCDSSFTGDMKESQFALEEEGEESIESADEFEEVSEREEQEEEED